MSLDIIRRVVARFRSAGKVPVGKTVVNGSLRIHRYSESIQVTDLTNAGKRGKRVQQMNFSGYHNPVLLEEIAERVVGFTDYSQVQGYAQELKSTVPSRDLKVSEEILRGVDVEPVGEVFQFKNLHDLEIQASPHDFLVNHHALMRNQMPGKSDFYQDTIYSADKKKDAAIFYTWLSSGNRFKLNNMTITDLRKLWDSLGVNYDSH